jgi:hypothetical protein
VLCGGAGGIPVGPVPPGVFVHAHLAHDLGGQVELPRYGRYRVRVQAGNAQADAVFQVVAIDSGQSGE